MTQDEIPGETVCILHKANTLGNGKNPIILPSAIIGKTRFFNLDMATALGTNNSEFKPVEVC